MQKFIKFIGGYTIRKNDIKKICDENNNKHLIDCHIGYLKKINFDETDDDKLTIITDSLNQYKVF